MYISCFELYEKPVLKNFSMIKTTAANIKSFCTLFLYYLGSNLIDNSSSHLKFQHFPKYTTHNLIAKSQCRRYHTLKHAEVRISLKLPYTK